MPAGSRETRAGQIVKKSDSIRSAEFEQPLPHDVFRLDRSRLAQ
jgi:hypothetical protein